MSNNPNVAVGDYVIIYYCNQKMNYKIVAVKDQNIYLETWSTDKNFVLSPIQDDGRHKNVWSYNACDLDTLQIIPNTRGYGDCRDIGHGLYDEDQIVFYQSCETCIDDVKNALTKYISNQENDESLPLRKFKVGRGLYDRGDDHMKTDKFLFIQSRTLLGAILTYKKWLDVGDHILHTYGKLTYLL